MKPRRATAVLGVETCCVCAEEGCGAALGGCEQASGGDLQSGGRRVPVFVDPQRCFRVFFFLVVYGPKGGLLDTLPPWDGDSLEPWCA